MRTVNNYKVGKVAKVLREALTTAEKGLKVIIAEGECMLAKQRRVRAEDAKNIAAGRRVAKPKFGIDDQVCTGDHSCIRLSGCPSLTIKENPDPLRRDPVATVIESCVGCGLCGEVSHAAILCPSFYKTEVVHNPAPDRSGAGSSCAAASSRGWRRRPRRRRRCCRRRPRTPRRPSNRRDGKARTEFDPEYDSAWPKRAPLLF